MTLKVHQDDIVEIIRNDNRLLVGKKGVVQQSLSSGMVIIELQTAVQYRDTDSGKIAYIKQVFLPSANLKVLDSPRDDRFDELENKVVELEDDLLIARSCLGLSEELRDKQHELIQKLIEEVDILQKEIYHLKGN